MLSTYTYKSGRPGPPVKNMAKAKKNVAKYGILPSKNMAFLWHQFFDKFL
jgi:hypothetical protein